VVSAARVERWRSVLDGPQAAADEGPRCQGGPCDDCPACQLRQEGTEGSPRPAPCRRIRGPG
jgi:hypothetical protein